MFSKRKCQRAKNENKFIKFLKLEPIGLRKTSKDLWNLKSMIGICGTKCEISEFGKSPRLNDAECQKLMFFTKFLWNFVEFGGKNIFGDLDFTDVKKS